MSAMTATKAPMGKAGIAHATFVGRTHGSTSWGVFWHIGPVSGVFGTTNRLHVMGRRIF